MPLTIADLRSICGHYDITDALFVQGYNMLLDSDMTGKQILEVCCGRGDLAGWLGKHTTANIVAIDANQEYLVTAKQNHGSLPNVTFLCGDAADLSDFKPASFDLIVGQATLHHLAGNLERIGSEYSRVLKPGGRLIFIFEPLGHNPVVGAIRAMRNAREEWLDESNLFEWALRDLAASFSRHEIYYFSLLAYFCKALPKQSSLSKRFYEYLNTLDQKMFVRWPGARKYAANFNVCYWK